MYSHPRALDAQRRIFGRRRRFSFLLVFWAGYLVLLALGVSARGAFFFLR